MFVLALRKQETSSLIGKLAVAAFLMIALGYPGEFDRTRTAMMSTRGFWGLSTIPFVHILAVLLGKITAALKTEKPAVAVLLRNAGPLTLFTWGFFPIAYMGPFFGLSGASA